MIVATVFRMKKTVSRYKRLRWSNLKDCTRVCSQKCPSTKDKISRLLGQGCWYWLHSNRLHIKWSNKLLCSVIRESGKRYRRKKSLERNFQMRKTLSMIFSELVLVWTGPRTEKCPWSFTNNFTMQTLLLRHHSRLDSYVVTKSIAKQTTWPRILIRISYQA